MVLLIGAIGVLLLYHSSRINLSNVGIAVLLTLLYSIPLLPFRSLHFTRKAGFMKTILLAFTWTFVTAYLPVAQHHVQFTIPGLLLLTKRFLFMLMLCILFDNRDATIDKVRGLSSLATDLSARAMQWSIYVVFFLLFALNFLWARYGISSGQRNALQLSSLAVLVVYFFSTKKQGYIFYYFVVDGMMFLSALLVTIASI